MAARVADKMVRVVMEENPCDGVVGDGPRGEDGVGGGEVAAHGAIDEEEGASGEPFEPEGLGVGQGGEVEFGAALGAEGGDGGGGDRVIRDGEERAGS